MKRLGLLLLAGALASCSKHDPPLSNGQALYKALNCRACHKIGASGASRGGPDLTMVGLRKNREWLNRYLADPQAWKKDTMMPNPRLSPKARELIVDYLLTLKGQDWTQGRPWNRPGIANPVERGHILYARAGCVTCHGVAGAGGYPNTNVPGGLIPALTDAPQRFTRAELKVKIVKGVTPQKKDISAAPPLLSMPAWGEILSNEEIDAVVEYVWTLKAADKAPSDW